VMIALRFENESYIIEKYLYEVNNVMLFFLKRGCGAVSVNKLTISCASKIKLSASSMNLSK
jgi:hypothetical protein